MGMSLVLEVFGHKPKYSKNEMLWPDDDAGWKHVGSPEFIQFIRKGTWTPETNFVSVHTIG